MMEVAVIDNQFTVASVVAWLAHMPWCYARPLQLSDSRKSGQSSGTGSTPSLFSNIQNCITCLSSIPVGHSC